VKHKVHTHTISDVANLQSELDSKAQLVHNHQISDIQNLDTELEGKASIGDVYVKTDFIDE
jgi:hypothetical protein